MRVPVISLLVLLVFFAGCSDVQSPTEIELEFEQALTFRVEAELPDDPAKDIIVEEFPVIGLEICVVKVDGNQEVGTFTWAPDDGPQEYEVGIGAPGQYEIVVTHIAEGGDGLLEFVESAVVNVLPMVITKVTVVPGQALVIGVGGEMPQNENALINGTFENVTLEGWTNVGPEYGSHEAVPYAWVPAAWGGPSPITPPYAGGDYCAYARTGGGAELGFSQTIEVPTGQEVNYHLDFAVRETQIPGQSRANQIVRLYLNDELVGESTFMILDPVSFGSFSGTFEPEGTTLTFTMVSDRGISHATGWGHVVFDNAVVSWGP